MVYFIGAGPGDPELLTIKGKKIIDRADVIIYAGSLVNPQLLDYKKEGCKVYNSAVMTLEEVLEVMEGAEKDGLTTVRLHTGDPCLYGAIREQMDVLEEKGFAYDSCPGVSSFCGAASALDLEYTLPDVSQSVIITRMAGRTPVPNRESIESFAAHKATMVIFLSTGMLEIDRIQKLIGDNVFMTSALAPGKAVLVCAEPEYVDLAVGLDLSVGYLELADFNHTFRIMETAALRVKDPAAIVVFA